MTNTEQQPDCEALEVGSSTGRIAVAVPWGHTSDRCYDAVEALEQYFRGHGLLCRSCYFRDATRRVRTRKIVLRIPPQVTVRSSQDSVDSSEHSHGSGGRCRCPRS